MWDPSIDNVYPRFEHRFSAAGFTAMRFPGGSVANTYHWKRAIGPLSQRGLNVHGHTGEPLTNGFGPDEFGSFVEHAGPAGDDARELRHRDRAGGRRLGGVHERARSAPIRTAESRGRACAPRTGTRSRTTSRTGRSATSSTSRASPTGWAAARWPSGPRSTYSAAPRSSRTSASARPSDHQASAAVSDGSADQRFQVIYPPVRPDKPFEITVDDEGWTRVRRPLQAPADDKVYELDPATGEIAFGDGVHGAIPPADSVVRASYKSGPHDGFVDYYSAMKAADPTIQVGSCFWNGHFLSMMGTKHPYDFVVKHLYSHLPPSGHSRREAVPRRDHVDRGQARERGDSRSGTRSTATPGAGASRSASSSPSTECRSAIAWARPGTTSARWIRPSTARSSSSDGCSSASPWPASRPSCTTRRGAPPTGPRPSARPSRR